MKTRKEIDDLKHNWICDPCWDIETASGFEDHIEDLKSYREYMQDLWRKQYEEHVINEMDRKGITDRATFDYLKKLENTIERLEERISKLEDK